MRALNFPAGRGAATALALLVLLAGPAEADPERRLEDVRRRLDATAAEQSDARHRLREARGGLEAVDDRRRRAIADLREVERRQAEFADRLAAVETDLEGAQDTLVTAEGRLSETAAALTAGETRLRETQEELERRRSRFAARARAAYKRGGGGYAALALDLSDAAAVGRGLAYVERVIDHDRTAVREVANLHRQVEDQVAGLEGLRQRQAAQRAVAERERDRLTQVLVEQQELTEQAAAEADRHRRLVAELEADRDSYLVLVDDLETQSAALESELARGAEERDAHEQVRRVEQERREAEARARKEAEAQAREAEEAGARREAEEAEARRVAEAEPEAARERGGDDRQGSRSSRSSPTPAVPASSPPVRGPAPSPSASPGSSAAPEPATGTARFARPVAGPVTSGYGYRTHPIHGDRRLHAGIDFGAPHGSPVRAAADGTVVTAGDRGGYGFTVVVDHGGGYTTLYAHLSAFAVSAGQRVSGGQVLGAVGSTGFSTGPHLHFEVRVNGRPRDPAPYL